MARIILGKVREGRIVIKRFFKKDLISFENKEIEIHLVQGGKTKAQLGYYWGVVMPIISQATGFTTEEAHEVYKKKFATYQKVHKGKVYKFTKGLSDMRVGEASEFISKVLNHARTDLGLIIPDADEEFKYTE